MTIAQSKKKVKKKRQKKRKVTRKKPSVNTRAGPKKKKRPAPRRNTQQTDPSKKILKKQPAPRKRKRSAKKKSRSSEVRRLEQQLERTKELLRQADYRFKRFKKSKKKRRGKRPTVGRPSKKIAVSRGEAAKRGWETRRANQLRAQGVAETAGGRTVPLSATPNIDPDSALGQFLRLPHVARQIEYRTVERGLYSHAPEWYLLPDPIIMVQLILAEQLGTFEERARELAAEFDWSLKEVYDLWHGY